MSGSPPATVRRVRTDEWEPLRAIRLRALATDPLAFSSTRTDEEGLGEDEWRRRAANGAMGTDRATFVAGLPDGTLVGLAAGRLVDGQPNVFSMWVDPDFRGRGLGGRLLDAVLAWARATAPGVPIRLEVNPTQRAALELYRSRGFRPTGETEPLGHTAGQEIHDMVRTGDPP